jgi:type VI secretion system protein ImpL
MALNRAEYTRAGRAIRAGRRLFDDKPKGFDAGTEIETYFEASHQYVGTADEPGPLDEFVASVRKAGAAVTSAELAGGSLGGESAQGQMAIAMGEVAAAAGGAPPQLKGFVEQATSGGAKATVSAAQGALSDAWTNQVLPDCKLATADKYPFVGSASDDASLVDVQRVFAMGGVLDAFVTQRIVPLLDMSGPIWRWNADLQATADLSPSSPEEFTKARKLRDVLVAGVTVRFEPKSFGADVNAVVLSTGGNQYRFEQAGSGERPVIWSAQGNVPEASLTMYATDEESQKDKEVEKLTESGPWALFRLMDDAKLENTGEQTLRATFGNGAKSVVFKVSLPSKQNPFIRGGGLWSFRCPVVL